MNQITLTISVDDAVLLRATFIEMKRIALRQGAVSGTLEQAARLFKVSAAADRMGQRLGKTLAEMGVGG